MKSPKKKKRTVNKKLKSPKMVCSFKCCPSHFLFFVFYIKPILFDLHMSVFNKGARINSTEQAHSDEWPPSNNETPCIFKH